MPPPLPSHRAPERTPEPPPHVALLPGPPRPTRAHRVWFVCDLLGITCAASTWLLVLGAGAVLQRALLLPAPGLAYGVANGALFHLLAALGLAAHARTMLTDPGSVPLGDALAPRDAPRCSQCGGVRPPRAHHCRVCGRCVRKMDHHCPWVNNCVGEGNQKYFVLFTLYTALASLHLLLLLGVPVLRSFARGEWGAHSTFSPRGSLVFLFLVALKGFLFTTVMFSTQLYAICADRTRIEQLQRERGGRRRSRWMNFKAVFGHRVSVAWISPFAAPEPQKVHGQHDVV